MSPAHLYPQLSEIAIAANGSKACAAWHHHNSVNTAQIVLMPSYTVTYNGNGATSGSGLLHRPNTWH